MIDERISLTQKEYELLLLSTEVPYSRESDKIMGRNWGDTNFADQRYKLWKKGLVTIDVADKGAYVVNLTETGEKVVRYETRFDVNANQNPELVNIILFTLRPILDGKVHLKSLREFLGES